MKSLVLEKNRFEAKCLIGNGLKFSHGFKNCCDPTRRDIEHFDLIFMYKYFGGKCTPWVVDLSGQMVNAWKSR